MNAVRKHIAVVGPDQASRAQGFAAVGGVDVVVSCHARLRGPYTGVDRVLDVLVPAIHRDWPKLVDIHRIEILTAVPNLESVIGSRPGTLVETTPHEERTPDSDFTSSEPPRPRASSPSCWPTPNAANPAAMAR